MVGKPGADQEQTNAQGHHPDIPTSSTGSPPNGEQSVSGNRARDDPRLGYPLLSDNALLTSAKDTIPENYIVSKVVSPRVAIITSSSFPPQTFIAKYFATTSTPRTEEEQEAPHALSNELAVYKTLADMQGECIPHCYGAFYIVPTSLSISTSFIGTFLILSYFSNLHPLSVVTPTSSSAYNLYALYTAARRTLESHLRRGVIPFDIHGENILVSASPPRVAFIDFEASQ
jgi:hypothetical protein